MVNSLGKNGMTVFKIVDNTVRERQLITHGNHIVLALSGGPDSMCMYDVLKRINEQRNLCLTFHPVHINHLLRGEDAYSDQEKAISLAESFGDECIVFQEDCKLKAKDEGKSFEEAGREIRYNAFYQVAKQLQIEHKLSSEEIIIAVGQNADDRAETTMFRIMRGSGVDGISSIGYERGSKGGFKVVRPILDVYKNQINEYCKEAGLTPAVDKTNLDMDYARNRIRGQVLPYLSEFEPKIKEMLNRLSDGAALDREFIELEAFKVLKKALINGNEHRDRLSFIDGGCLLEDGSHVNSVFLNCAVLRENHKAVLYRVMVMALTAIGYSHPINRAYLKQFLDLIHSDLPSGLFYFHGNFRCRRQYEHLIFERVQDVDTKNNKLDVDGNKKSKKQAYISKSWMAERGIKGDDLKLRKRMAGDYILIKDGKKKKVQDLLVDMKVPKVKREEAVLLASGSLVLAIETGDGRIRYSDGVKCKDEDFLNNLMTVEMILPSC